MNLQDFIRETLVQVVNGVKDAQSQLADMEAAINPVGLAGQVSQLEGRRYSRTGQVSETVEFDIAVTVTEGESTKKGVGAFVSVVGIGAQKQTEAQSSSVSRVKFNVQVLLPPGKDFRDKTKSETPKGKRVIHPGYSATRWQS